MIGKPEAHHPAKLALFHQNPRVGDVDAIAGSLRANGQYKPVVVNRGTHTGRPLEVLAGNHTVMAMRNLAEEYPSDDRWQEVSAWVIDVDDDRATRIVAADNRTAELGSFDDRLLAEMLAGLEDLEGTGYEETDRAALEDLLTGAPSLDDLADEYGDPEDDDFNVMVRISVSPPVADQWRDYAKGHDSEGEAFEALLDGRTGQPSADG